MTIEEDCAGEDAKNTALQGQDKAPKTLPDWITFQQETCLDTFANKWE